MNDDAPDLSTAYALKTPDDSKRLYAEWARNYDTGFAVGEDYQLHLHTARAFITAGGRGSVLDVGAGTGLCGAALADLGADLGVGPIDATDISAEMLEVAMTKGIYRTAITADLTQKLPMAKASYSGIVSSGTFTTGHVGPDAIDALLHIACKGAQFALSINAQHFEAAGFGSKLRALQAGSIQNLTLPETRIYGDRATGEHRNDIALIALFEKA